MRQKRAKTYRKLMQMYQDSFGFHQPYQLLADATFCQESTKTKLLSSDNVGKMLGNIVQGTCKPMITQCCITELYKLGKAEQPSVDLAKSFERRKCNHRESIAGYDCMKSVVGPSNKHRYLVATQSVELRNTLREIPAVPIIHINRSVLVLEPPSQVTLAQKGDVEETALHPHSTERPADSSEVQPPRKIRGPKGPNPLSMKKKKPKERLPKTRQAKPEIVADGSLKRKRSVDDGDENEPSEPRQDTTLILVTAGDVVEGQRQSRKRKRRKGKSNLNPTNPSEEEADE